MKQAFLAILAIVAIFLLLGRLHSEPDDGRKVIEFWSYGTGGASNPGIPFWNAVADEFMTRHPDVKVQVVADIAHGPYLSVLTTRFIGGNPPDVMIMDDGYIGQLAQEGLVQSLEGFIESDPNYDAGEFPPSMVRDGYVGADRYGIPWYGGYGYILYRKDIFTEAGVQPPRTWDELVAVCRTIQAKTDLEFPFAMDTKSAFWIMPFVWQNGGSIISDDHRTITIDTPEFVGGLQFVHDLMHKHKVMDPALAAGSKVVDAWSMGSAAMVIDGSWNAGRNDGFYPQWEGKWDVAAVPAGREAVSFFGGQHLLMSAHTEHPDLVWEFMAMATSVENHFRYLEMTGQPPGNLRVYESDAFDDRFFFFRITPDVIKQGRNSPFVPCFAKVWYRLFQSTVIDVVMKDPDADIAAVVEDAAKDMQHAVDEYWATHEHFVQGKPQPVKYPG
ncbi:MAG: sugar ABC transporter substrate-binding protein [bacterium]|nr:sugar ABC transporter substrate-binding protein [bacterium]